MAEIKKNGSDKAPGTRKTGGSGRNDAFNDNAKSKSVGEPQRKPRATVSDDNDKNDEVKMPSGKIIHQIMPFVMFVLALFFGVLFILESFDLNKPLGDVGYWIFTCFFGLFGIGAYLVPMIFILFGIKWGKYVDSHRMGIKLLLAGLLALTVSMLVQVCVSDAEYPGIPELWESGTKLCGGGFIGGSLGWLCYVGLSIIGSLILLISALLLLIMFLFDLTPKNVWTWFRYKKKLREERIAREREQYEAENAARLRVAPVQQVIRQPEPTEPEPTVFPDGKSRGSILRIRRKGEVSETPVEDEPADDSFHDIVPEEPDMTLAPSVPPVDEIREVIPDVPETVPENREEVKEPEKVTLDKLFVNPDVSQTEANDEDDGAEHLEVEVETVSEPSTVEAESGQLVLPWVQPPIDLLKKPAAATADQSESIALTKAKLRETLESFDIKVRDIGYSVGPTITRYEVVPEAGVRVRAIANLVDDIAMNLATVGVRIEAPIPNKPAVGVEVPNEIRSNVYLRTLIDNDMFWKSSPLTVCLGQDVAGKNVYFDIKKMPHLIIAGTTGSGKSVCMNCIVCSLLYKNPPDKVKLIMIDPKKVEFNVYQHIPHLNCPIITDMKKAAGALASAVAEMERRYTIIEDVGVRDVDSYNQMTARDPDREYLPKLIIVIDELADLMMLAKQDVEGYIQRIAQKARAVGIHLIIGTQRPSVDVITGLIKANVPSRIACTVKSQVDSRTILDIAGAEKLIGHGDMLFSPVGLSKPMRVQGAFLEDSEVEAIVDFIKTNNQPVEYNRGFMDSMEAAASAMEAADKKGGSFDMAGGGDSDDDKFRQALEVAVNEGRISTSLLQRKLSIGYGKAAKIIDHMEELGYVSEPDGNKPRRILLTKQEFYEKVINDEIPTGEE